MYYDAQQRSKPIVPSQETSLSNDKEELVVMKLVNNDGSDRHAIKKDIKNNKSNSIIGINGMEDNRKKIKIYQINNEKIKNLPKSDDTDEDEREMIELKNLTFNIYCNEIDTKTIFEESSSENVMTKLDKNVKNRAIYIDTNENTRIENKDECVMQAIKESVRANMVVNISSFKKCQMNNEKSECLFELNREVVLNTKFVYGWHDNEKYNVRSSNRDRVKNEASNSNKLEPYILYNKSSGIACGENYCHQKEVELTEAEHIYAESGNMTRQVEINAIIDDNLNMQNKVNMNEKIVIISISEIGFKKYNDQMTKSESMLEEWSNIVYRHQNDNSDNYMKLIKDS
ncbi:hypothetical protein C2G38_2211102 [Gigaspora rosea]|uniref:Uncharacterized protein n=1 Tax=Gigaspora rosea TaxID=44941 RepID=A0A397UEE7_9GLOM|nr:hypothetical protein C2G38_2211102 [Gigaspora rosea]